MKLVYRFDETRLRISEQPGEQDIELLVEIADEDGALPEFKQVKAFFERDTVYTDVLFYAYPDHKYRVIVRKDYYTDFVLKMFKHGLLLRVEWERQP